jgi:hypothetical protein
MMRFLFLLFFLISFAPFSRAQEEEKNPILSDPFYIELGIFVPSKNIKLGANGSSENEEIDFGKTFNFNNNQATYFFNAEWRWNKKWRLAVETFGINNAAKATLDNDIVFEDITFEKGSYVRGGVEFGVYRLFVGRIISSGPKHSLGAGLGIHAMNIGAFIEGEVKSTEGDLEFQRRRVSALVPVPNVGAWYHFAPTPKWAFVARVDWFGITIDQYSGGLWDIAPGVKYQIIKNLGVGIDYRFFFLNARVNETKWDGKFNMDFQGPLFTIHGNF